MRKFSRHYFLLVVAGCLLQARPAPAAAGVNGNLVDVRWLEKNLKNTDVLILDASPGRVYAAQHIPGAVSFDLMALRGSYGIQDAPAADVERLYQSRGISPGKKIVMYDQGGSMFATRLFFSLYHHGFPAEDLLVLDGGLFKWQQEGLPVTKDATPAPATGSFRIEKPREGAKATLTEFLVAAGDLTNNVLLEALGADWHFGEALVLDKPGHIPHAILLPTADFYNPDKTFKSPEEIRRMATYLGIKPEQQIYTHCGGGVAASVPFFALKFLSGYSNVKMFKDSQMGWVADGRDLPFWTYDAPYLMRRTSWVQSWGGQRMRMYGLARVSIVDVRPAAEFARGHVPFSLNVPAGTLRSNLADPDKLAEILERAGVDASHEAVVVSGSGLSKDAALAFAVLEKLGQKKTSVFMDSMGEWTKAGFTLTKDATVVGTGKNPGDFAVPPTTYPRSPRQDVIIAEPRSTQGLYPKVFVASGTKAPAKAPASAPEGQVAHVPYTGLLNGDGTPKAAKDIWSVLTKAGVPRYAELVCFADDPGEAAANYFILKLMGYPDVKVLVN